MSDTRRDRTRYIRGPGPRSTPGPVASAYMATGAFGRPCPDCGAQPLEYCTIGHREHREHRKMPCLSRIRFTNGDDNYDEAVQ